MRSVPHRPAPSTRPEIKVSYLRGNLQALDALSTSQRRDAQARLANVMTAVDLKTRLEWAPIDWDIEISRVVVDVAGLAAIRAVNKRSMLLSLEGPLIRPFVTTGVALWGPSPSTFLRFIAKAWTAATRNVGDIEVRNRADGEAVLAFTRLPTICRSDPAWLESNCGVVEGIYAATRHTGTVSSPRHDGDDVVYDMRWQVPNARAIPQPGL